MHTIEAAAHTAWLDPVTGVGWVTVLADLGPLLALDLSLNMGSDGEAPDVPDDWDSLTSQLLAHGWSVDDTETVAVLPDGRAVWLALGPGIASEPDAAEILAAESEFVALTGALPR